MGRIHRTKSREDNMNIKTGDLIQLGPHKLICGDSLQPSTYTKLIQDNKIDLVITDPPYGVNYGEKNKQLNKIGKGNRIENNIINDNIQDYNTFFQKIFTNWKPYLQEYNSIYIFISDLIIHKVITQLENTGYTYNTTLKWIKNNHVYGFNDYMKKSEPIIYAWYKKHKFYGGFNTDVLEYNKPRRNKLHPTLKPLKLVGKLMLNNSQPDMNILDPFGGSGTTLPVSEKLHRNCYMIEKDPHYIKTIIQRYTKLTGKQPHKI